MPIKKISSQCLTDFLAEDLTQTQIAKACNISRQAVHARINYTKTPERERRLLRHFSVIFLRRLGFTIPELVKYTKYCDNYVRKLLRENKCIYVDQNYTPKILKNSTTSRHFQIKFLYRLGFDFKTIAEFTGYRHNTVRQYLYSFGLSLKGQLK